MTASDHAQQRPQRFPLPERASTDGELSPGWIAEHLYRRRRGGIVRAGQIVSGKQGTEHVVVVVLRRIGPVINVRAIQQRCHLIGRGAAVLIPGDDQQRIVAHGPLRIGIEVLLQPAIHRRDRGIVPRVIEVWDDE